MAAASLAIVRTFEDETLRKLADVRAELARHSAATRAIPDVEKRLEGARLARAGGDAPYRAHDLADLERELEVLRSSRPARARLRIEEARLMSDLERARQGLERRGIRKVALPLLENVEIASPCDVSWADMEGDTDVRFCKHCKKDVFNISMMSREEAEAVVGSAAKKDLCVRLFRRADGTVLTSDCAVGARRHRFWRRTRGIATAGLLFAALGVAAYERMSHCVVQTAGTAGAMSALPG